MTNQTPENGAKPISPKKYYVLLAMYYLFILFLVAFIGGSVQVYWNRKIGVAVTIAIVIAGWVGYKYISRSYREGTLFNKDGKLKGTSGRNAESQHSEDNAEIDDIDLNNPSLSAKDKARLLEIQRQRRELRKNRKGK